MRNKPKPVAVFGADTHISELVWSQRPRLRGDAFFGLSQLVDLAVEYSVPLVLAGDCLELLDANALTSTTLQFVNGQIERLRLAGSPLYYISGQHDMSSPSWLGAMNSWAQDISGRVISLGGRDWYGLDFQEPPALAAAMSLRPESYGLIMHQRWAELAGKRGHQGELREIERSRVVVTGDMHLKCYKKVGKVHVFSPGATHKRRVDEPDEHFAVVLSDDDSLQFKRIRSRLTLRVVIDPNLNVRRQLDNIVAEVRKLHGSDRNTRLPVELQQPFVIFDSGGHFEQAYRRLSDDVADIAHVFTRGKRKQKEAIDTFLAGDEGPTEQQWKTQLSGVFESVVVSKVADPMVRDILIRAQRGEPLLEEIA